MTYSLNTLATFLGFTPAKSGKTGVMVNPAKVTPMQLHTLRSNVVADTAKAYGANKAYAEGLVTVFGEDFPKVTWPAMFGLAKADFTPEQKALAKAVQGEKDALYAAAKKAGHTNPSVIWSRVRDCYKPEDQRKGAGANQKRELGEHQRLTIEKLIKRFYRDDSDETPEQAVTVNEALELILEDIYGVDLAAWKGKNT